MSFHNVPPNGFPDLPDVEELEAVQKDVQNLKTMKAAKADIAPEFSATSNYAVGDMVYHDGTLYKCTTVHEAAAWNADHFAAATVAGELSELNSNLNGVSTYTDCKGTSQASSLEYMRAVYNSTTKIVDVGGYITDVSFVQGLTVIDQVVTPTGRPIIDIAVSVFTTESATVYAYITTSGNLAVHSDVAFSGSLFLSGVYTVG